MTDLEKLVRDTASELRKTNGRQLARKTGFSKSAVYRWRRPTLLLLQPLSVLIRLIAALHPSKKPKPPRPTTVPHGGTRPPTHSAKKKSS